MKKLLVEFDLENDQIKMKSDAVNVNGEALFEWTLDPETGEIMEATREQDASKEKIIERQVNPDSLENAEVVKALEKIEAAKPDFINQAAEVTQDTIAANQTTIEESSTEAAAGMDFDSLDMQRDMAFKIVYFFIVFIVATFGLLYAYFQMNKKELEEEQ